jgi:hypothetical protein
MLVSHRHKFIYLKPRKVAGTSVESFLERYCVSPEDEPTYEITHDTDYKFDKYGIISSRMRGKSNTIWYNHKSSNEIKKELPNEVWDTYTKICNIRNPYDMMVSWFHYETNTKGVNKNYFTNFIQNQIKLYGIKLNKNIWSEDGKFNFRYIRFENIEEDLKTIMDELDLPDYQVELPHFKKSNRSNWRDYYTTETKNIVYKLFEEEINHFNYEF